MVNCRKIISGVALVVALASCSKEVQVVLEDDARAPMTFTVFNGDSQKAVLSDTTKVLWSQGEGISIIDGAFVSDAEHHNRKFITKSGGASTVFEGTCDVADTYYAVSPYFAYQGVGNTAAVTGKDQKNYFNVNTKNAANSITTILPYSQKAIAGSFDPQAHLMIGKSASSTDKRNIRMKHLCGLIMFTLSGAEDIKEIEFCGNNGERLCGPVLVKFDEGGNPVLDTSVSDAYYEGGFGKELFLRHLRIVPSSGNIIPDGTYFISLPPTNFTKSFTFRFKRADGTIAEKPGNIALEISRAGMLNLGTIDISGLVFRNAIEIPFYLYPRQAKWKFPLSTAASVVASPCTNGYYDITNWPSSASDTRWNAPSGSWYLNWLNQEKPVKAQAGMIFWPSDGYTFHLWANKYISPHEINGLRMSSTAAKSKITFPGIAGKKLRRIDVSAGGPNTLSVTDVSGNVVRGGTARNLAVCDEISYNLPDTTAGISYKLAASSINLRSITLYFE